MAYIPIKIATNLSSAISEQGGYLLPVNTVENWTEHFTDNSWSTPQDQINAGYPIFIQPAEPTGYYEEVYDCESLLGERQIVASYSGSNVASGITITTDIAVSTDNITYTTYTNVSSLIVSGFRYIKVRVNVASDTLGLYSLTDLSTVVNEQFNVELLPTLFTNNNTFYDDEAGFNLDAELFTNENVIYGSQIDFNINADIYNNTNEFYAESIAFSIKPSRYNNTNAFYGAEIDVNINAGLFTNNNSFYTQLLKNTNAVSVDKFDNNQTFYAVDVELGPAPQSLVASRFNNTNAFYDVTIEQGPGMEYLAPALFVNNNEFFYNQVTSKKNLNAGYWANNNVFYIHRIYEPYIEFSQRVSGSDVSIGIRQNLSDEKRQNQATTLRRANVSRMKR